MENERLESALAWCEKNQLDSTRLKKFNRLNKRKRSKKKWGRFLTEKAKKDIQSYQ